MNANPKAVFRVDDKKPKTKSQIKGRSTHQLRSRETLNANKAGIAPLMAFLANGQANPYQSVLSLLEGVEKRNKTTVLCREAILSASPSFFRPGREDEGGFFERDRLKDWVVLSMEWAHEQWPGQLASAVLHLDEQTPHFHFLIVPKEKKPDGTWHLNSKKFFDRKKLIELQDSIGEKMAPLGIERGKKNSKANHTEIKQFYGEVVRGERELEFAANAKAKI